MARLQYSLKSGGGWLGFMVFWLKIRRERELCQSPHADLPEKSACGVVVSGAPGVPRSSPELPGVARSCPEFGLYGVSGRSQFGTPAAVLLHSSGFVVFFAFGMVFNDHSAISYF